MTEPGDLSDLSDAALDRLADFILADGELRGDEAKPADGTFEQPGGAW